AIPILKKLHSHSNLNNQMRIDGVEPDYFKERQAMLELSIARSLARCGSKTGYEVLISYLEDIRSLLSEQAHTELKAITGRDFQKDTVAWRTYLGKHRLILQPCPV